MNGECKSYRLNEPMSWKEFLEMPDDIQIAYVKALRQKFAVADAGLGEMFGVSKDVISFRFRKLGLNKGETMKRKNWDKDGFYAWWHGVEQIPVQAEESDHVEELTEETAINIPEVNTTNWIQAVESIVDDDQAFAFVPIEKYRHIDEENALLKAQIDGLQKANDALMARNEEDCGVIEKLRLLCSEQEEKMKILEAQMEVVRLIFGGKNNV